MSVARRQVIGWLLAAAGAFEMILQYDPLTFYYWFPMDSHTFAPFARFLLELDRTPLFFTLTRMALAAGLLLIALWATSHKWVRRALLAVAVILAVEVLGLTWISVGELRDYSYQVTYVLLAVGFLTSGVLALKGRIFLPAANLLLSLALVLFALVFVIFVAGDVYGAVHGYPLGALDKSGEVTGFDLDSFRSQVLIVIEILIGAMLLAAGVLQIRTGIIDARQRRENANLQYSRVLG